MKIQLENFNGMIPRRHPRLLPNTGAEISENTKLWSGKIKPWKGNELICDPYQTTPQSIYLFGKHELSPGYWFQFAEAGVDVVKGQVGGDDTVRTYITGGPYGQPQVTDKYIAIRGEEEVWSADEHYTLGNIVVGTATSNIYFECTTAGTAGSSEPTWDVTPSNTTNDGTIVWTTRTLTASTLCSELPDASVNLGVPAPVDAPTVERTGIKGNIAGIGEYSGTQQALSGTYPTPFVVTADGSSQTLTMSISVQIWTIKAVSASGQLTFNLWRDTAATNPIASTVVTRDNWDGYEAAIPSQNESGTIYHNEVLTETISLGVGDHSYSINVKTDNFEIDPRQISVQITFSATYGPQGAAGNGLRIDLGTLTENPFMVGSQILINDVVGAANSNFEEVNGQHDVVEVGGNSVMIVIASLDAADYTSGGTWEYVPNDTITFERFYVYTYIARMGTLLQEGPPSPVSTTLGLTEDSGVDISAMSVPPAGYNISRIRIYRTVLGAETAEFKYVDEIGAENTAYADILKEGSTNIGEVLLSEDWNPPPADLHDIVQMPNGIMVGLSKNEVYLSEPFQPHAWPDAYRRSMEFNGVSTGVFGNTVLITTNGAPYLLTGADPESMSMDKLEISQACAAKRSTVDMGYSVLYASKDGIVQVGPGIAALVTEPLFTKDEWLKLDPSSMLSARWDDRYVCFFTDIEGRQRGFVFDPKNPEASLTDLDYQAAGAYTDPDDADLYLIDESKNIVMFDSDNESEHEFLWMSKRFHIPRPVNFSAAKIQASGYPVGFTLYSIERAKADTALNEQFLSDDLVRIERYTGTVSNGLPFRLPAGFTSDEYQIEVTGDTTIEGVYIAETLRELRLV